MNAICKMTHEQTTWPCPSPTCPLYGDCLAEWQKQHVKPLTNAARIRAMSDEELATFISEIAGDCETNTACHQHCNGCDIEYCEYRMCLKWLQQPAEGE